MLYDWLFYWLLWHFLYAQKLLQLFALLVPTVPDINSDMVCNLFYLSVHISPGIPILVVGTKKKNIYIYILKCETKQLGCYSVKSQDN